MIVMMADNLPGQARHPPVDQVPDRAGRRAAGEVVAAVQPQLEAFLLRGAVAALHSGETRKRPLPFARPLCSPPLLAPFARPLFNFLTFRNPDGAEQNAGLQHSIQGTRGTLYAGSWTLVNTHEIATVGP